MRMRWLSWCMAAMMVILSASPALGAESKSFYDYYESSFEVLRDEEAYEMEEEDTRTFVSSDERSGPGGSAAAVTESEVSFGKGPVIHNVTLSGSYHEEFDVYEIAMNQEYFLYSNVANGEITDGEVYVEIPDGVIYTMKRDGQEIGYQSGQRVSAHGTYLLYLTVVKDDTLPLYRQEEYRAVFRFRIQEKPAHLKESISGFEGPGPQFLQETLEELEESQMKELEGMIPVEEETVPEETEAAADTEQTEAAEDENYGEEEAPSAVPVFAAHENPSAWDQTYDPTGLLYHMSMEDGSSFTSNIPEGMTATGIVRLNVEAGNVFNLYCNDVLVEYESGSDLMQNGRYRLEVNDHPWYFEITDFHVSRDYYLAPKHMKITRAGYQGKLMELDSDRYLPMKEDGEYSITLNGENGDSFQISLTRDTKAPEVAVAVEGGKAHITYGESDLKTITLTKNGEVLSNVSASLVEEPGDYVVTAEDRAGNQTAVSFHLDYVLNTYAVVSIILLCGLVIAGVAAVLRMKRTLHV